MLCRDTSRGTHSRRLACLLGLFTWLVYVRTYCVPIATLNQNSRSRLLYSGGAQIIKIKTSFRGKTSGGVEKCRPFSQTTLIGSE